LLVNNFKKWLFTTTYRIQGLTLWINPKSIEPFLRNPKKSLKILNKKNVSNIFYTVVFRQIILEGCA